MNFGFTEEQELLRAELRKFLDQNAPLKRVREIVETESGCDASLWNRMAELGWVGLNMPEAHGGAGLDLETLIVVLEETGRSLFPSPLISTVLAAKASSGLGTRSSKRGGFLAWPMVRRSGRLRFLNAATSSLRKAFRRR
jgi:alkylation response protein AidB-like acyl-CoA dehydrogenase